MTLFTALIFSGCTTSSSESASFDPNACRSKVRDSMEFASDSARTRAFFAEYVNNPGMEMEIFFNVLGRNISSTLLAMKEPYSDKISLRLNPDLDAAAAAMNKRVMVGGSILEMQDVVGMTMVGEFLRVDVNAPEIVSGYFYVICKEIEGRTLQEQTFVDYTRPDGATGKMSIQALVSLLL